MQVIPEKPHHRRTAYIVIGLVLIIILLLRFFVVPRVFDTTKLDLPTAINALPTAINAVLDALFATGLATIAIASLLLWLSPPIMARSRIDVIEPREIGSYLKQGRQNAREWWYRGGCGRFTRAVTIPNLASEARSQNFTKIIKVQILDPTDTRTCKAYANYRNRLRSARDMASWTEASVRHELLATIVSAYGWKAEQPLLDIEIGLHRTFSLLRIDLSSNLAVLTKEDPLEPALLCDAGSFFHDSFLEDLRLTLDQSRRLSREVPGVPRRELTVETTRDLLKALGLKLEPEPSDQDVEEVIGKVQNAKDPYA